jgi:uncharacterized RDD family membrane protein YckC
MDRGERAVTAAAARDARALFGRQARRSIPGAMRCETCGAIKEQAAAACPSCGAPAPALAAAVRAGEADADALALPAGADAAVAIARERDMRAVAEAATLRAMAARLRTGAPPRALRPAGFFVRLFAFVIDLLVLALFTVPLAVAGFAGMRAGLFTIGATAPLGAEETLESFLVLAWLAMAGIYFTALHRGAGQTIGKAAFGIGVRSAGTLAAIGTFRSLVRTLGYVLSSTLFGLGFLTVALTPRKRGWHDYLAGTCVVRLATDEV